MNQGRWIVMVASFAAGIGLIADLTVVEASPIRSIRTESNRVVLTMEPGLYRILPGEDGARIEMEGFVQRGEPGAPALPAATVLAALPPGAAVRAIETRAVRVRPIDGAHRIIPMPPVIPLGEGDAAETERAAMREEWEATRRASYAAEGLSPSAPASVDGFGTLRKYTYASITFWPFRYEPRPGRLELIEEAEVVVEFDLPSPGSETALTVAESLHDTTADDRAARLFANFDQVRSLYSPMGLREGARTTYDYLIITTSSLYSTVVASDFVAWKTSLGHSVRVLRTIDSEILSQPGRDMAERIRNFLRANYLSWGTRYVLLVGGYQGVPMRYCYPNPNNHAHNPTNVNNPGGSVPTDAYYADLSFSDAASWDFDGDGYLGEYGQDRPDFMPDLYVGRIPSDTPSRVAYALSKSIAFEQDRGGWKNHVLQAGAILFFANQNHQGYPRIDGATVLAHIEADHLAGMSMSRYSEREGLDPSHYLWAPLNLTAFSNDWRQNRHAVVNWSGHGWPDGAYRYIWVWDDGDGVAETGNGEIASPPFINITASIDDDAPSIVFAISCNVAYPEPNGVGNLGVDLLTRAGFGSSVGVLASTRVAAVNGNWVIGRGGAEGFCYEFNRHLFRGPNGPESVGEAIHHGKFFVHQNAPMNHYYDYWNFFDYVLYGDPALRREGAAPASIAEGETIGSGRSALRLRIDPNPIRTGANISYKLPRAAHVRIDLIDVAGRRVALLMEEERQAGFQSFSWLVDASPSGPIPSGAYWIRVRSSAAEEAQPVLLLR